MSTMARMILGVAVLVALGLAARDDERDAKAQDAHYCEMVQLHKQTHGAAGWPAYRGTGVCTHG